MSETLSIGPFLGGGLVLGYKCPSRCRHCLYGAGPHRKDGKPSPEELEEVLDSFVRLAPRAHFHIGGGEPFLDMDILKRAIAGMTLRRLALDYVETNASWVKSAEEAERVLSELADLGLRGLLVSVSPFHAEFVPFEKTAALITAANRILPGGAFVWVPQFLSELSSHPADKKLDLDKLLKEKGDDYALSIGDGYGLVPGGRAGRYFAAHGRAIRWREVAGRAPCSRRLVDTSHFHVDGQGLYVPGLCAGIALPFAELNSLPLEKYPVVRTLLRDGGLLELVEYAIDLGFKPLPTYSAACDLCTHVRCFLFENQRSPDLGPDGFYDPRSLTRKSKEAYPFSQ